MIDTSAAPGRSTSRLPASGLSTTSGRSTYRRILRRETHSPRSTLAIVLAIVVIVACAWFGAEIVLATLGHPALLVSPRQLAAAVVSAPSYTASIVVATGVAASVVTSFWWSPPLVQGDWPATAWTASTAQRSSITR